MIDIHMHTIYSDGDKTVEEVLKMCEERKLEYISITDHNTCPKPDIEIGIGRGNLNISKEIIEEWINQ